MSSNVVLPPAQQVEVSAHAPKYSKASFLRSLSCTWKYEDQARIEHGAQMIAGVDEVGRGCLMACAVVAAVCLPRECCIEGLKDSKQLTARQRERLDKEIREAADAVAIIEIDPATIDRINIYQACRLGMKYAVEALDPPADFVLVDAIRIDTRLPQLVITHGDALSVSIAAASIVAKVYRDNLMLKLDEKYPGYGLAKHKGYGTPAHLEALRRLGPSEIHRRSFAPVRQMSLITPELAAELDECAADSAATEPAF